MKRNKFNVVEGVIGDTLCRVGLHAFCDHPGTRVDAAGAWCRVCDCQMEYVREIRAFKPVSDVHACLRGCGKVRE